MKNLVQLLLLAIAVLLSVTAAWGENVSVRVVFHDDVEGSSRLEGILLAEPADPNETSVREWAISIPWEGELDLDPSSRWRLIPRIVGFWAAEEIVRFTSEPKPIVLRLFRTGQLVGHLRSSVDEPLPQAVSVRFQSAPRIGERGLLVPIPSTVLECPVGEVGDWICEVPSGELDLKLHIEGFIPYYLWDVVLRARETNDLGILRLERGASLAGWIETSEEREDAKDASVTLELKPLVMGWHGNPRERERIKARSQKGTANDRGFFQLRGIPQGGYVLRAMKTGFASTELSPVEVSENREIFLENALVLHPPATLEVFIDPPFDPWGNPWIGLLAKQHKRSMVMQTKSEKAASPEGYWSKGRGKNNFPTRKPFEYARHLRRLALMCS